MNIWIIIGAALLIGLSVFLFYNPFKSKGKRDLNKVLSEISEQIVLLEDIETVSVKIKDILIKYLEAINVSIIIYDDDKGDYTFMNPEDNNKGIAEFKKQYNKFFIYLETQDKLLSSEELESNKIFSDVRENTKKYFSDLRAVVTVPLIFERRLIGIINLEKKKDKKKYDDFDFQILRNLRREITVAFTNSLLFGRISKLFEEVEEQNSKLRELDKAKSAFIANISHELRTPLVSVKGYIEYILLGKFGPLTNKQEEGLRVSFKNIKRFERLINSLLLYAQIQAGKANMVYEKIDLSKLIDECIEEEKILANKKNVELIKDVPEDIIVKVDIDKIKQALLNLVSNAIKFTERGHVKVKVELEGNKAKVFVIDTGIGIPQDKIGTIFERFEQVDNSSERNYGGTGLGLSIVKSIVEMHKSKIKVESKLGEGTAFSFSLPVYNQN